MYKTFVQLERTSTMSTSPRILISGGGIAGNALALQLVRAGIHTTVVERAATPRSMITLRAPASRSSRLPMSPC